MCGIVGCVGRRNVVPVILDGLRRLEYRGYDSAGIATVVQGAHLELRRAEGKLRNLEEIVRLHPLAGTYGIGHTRWATHGRPSEQNAHPHRDCSGHIVVVHNGIVENYVQLRRELVSQGHHFRTETDTEVIAHLVERYVKVVSDGAHALPQAVSLAVQDLRGVFAIGVICEEQPDTIVAARNGPPVVIGVGRGEYFLASDVPAILPHTRDVIFLNDGDLAVLTLSGVTVTDLAGEPRTYVTQHVDWDPGQAEKGTYAHFMLKEIFEQPQGVLQTIVGRVHPATGITLEGVELSEAEIRRIEHLHIVACGTSWYAATAGKVMIESATNIPVEVDCASEYRYRTRVAHPNTLVVLISQSGETADTLAAQRQAKAQGCKTIAICNVVGSMIAREADGNIYTHAGPGIGVASTKAFTAQLTALNLLSLYLAQKRGLLRPQDMGETISGILCLPGFVEEVLHRAEDYQRIARQFTRAQNALYLGRGIHYATALEGALKLKEISYVHAEGLAAGEMKHGANALITDQLPVIVIATRDLNDPASVTRYEKTVSNMKEVHARMGHVIAVANDGDTDINDAADDVLYVPNAPECLLPILEVIPLQLFAYEIALKRGCDIDQPRNLAKSVTVE